MNYELAKELKDAGFPQVFDEASPAAITKHGLTYYDEHSNSVLSEVGGYISLPTLSELIEACIPFSQDSTGDFHLERNAIDGTWGASIDCFKNKPYISGSTLEEAVARLWLSLSPTRKGDE